MNPSLSCQAHKQISYRAHETALTSLTARGRHFPNSLFISITITSCCLFSVGDRNERELAAVSSFRHDNRFFLCFLVVTSRSLQLIGTCRDAALTSTSLVFLTSRLISLPSFCLLLVKKPRLWMDSERSVLTLTAPWDFFIRAAIFLWAVTFLSFLSHLRI